MGTSNRADELRRAAFTKKIVGYRFKEWERKVHRDFWTTLKHFAGQVPFTEDLVAAYYCALDPETPMRVRAILVAKNLLQNERLSPLPDLRRSPQTAATPRPSQLYNNRRSIFQGLRSASCRRSDKPCV